ncbi:MAG: type II toxin-antitoxin system VapC family toxin [Cyanobacteria bacterium RU_5_0]|nr:type II toxin-antitoxin system VapC family toxin [Cyanobacteria bacterium RU_5_0]
MDASALLAYLQGEPGAESVANVTQAGKRPALRIASLDKTAIDWHDRSPTASRSDRA